MKKNVHDVERVFRLVGGAFLSSMMFWGPKKKIFGLFVIPMITGATGKCPAYSALDINTRENKEIDVEKQANDYVPVQSPSEIAAGHPLVGTA
jgi:hypothetical protein